MDWYGADGIRGRILKRKQQVICPRVSRCIHSDVVISIGALYFMYNTSSSKYKTVFWSILRRAQSFVVLVFWSALVLCSDVKSKAVPVEMVGGYFSFSLSFSLSLDNKKYWFFFSCISTGNTTYIFLICSLFHIKLNKWYFDPNRVEFQC